MSKWNMFFLTFTLVGAVLIIPSAMAGTEPLHVQLTGLQMDELSIAANNYYVDNAHPSASDTNPGTEDAPWLTIQHAADEAQPGDTIIVKQGQYDERVVVRNSGTAEAKISFQASPRRTVLMQGFYFNEADYIRVEGFRISNSLTGWSDRFGALINGDNIEVIDNEFFDMKASAIQGLWGEHNSSSITIANNTIYHSQMGITVYGTNWIVENNEIERLFMYEGGDCDYMRFFGEDHIIHNNYMHGTDFSEVGSAHVDCFQTFDNNGEHVHNILVEGNTCFVFHQGFMGEASFHENSSHVTFRNNVFAHGGAWGIDVHQIDNVMVENNTFYDIQYHGAGFRNNSLNNVVVNNIFYNTGTSYWASDGATLSGDHNLIFESNDPGQIGPNDILGVDPLLIDPGHNDFHLGENSPAIDAGQTLADVTRDLEGTPRPQGGGYDIGAYEFGGPTPTFQDVPFDHWAHDYIEALYQGGYVAGCSTTPRMYCPERIMNRAESAVFVVRGVHGADFTPPDPSEKIFEDVPLTEWYAKWATQLWNDGYTAGCGTDPLIYCPLQEHTIAEGTVFYLRMQNGSDYEPPQAMGIFTDVPLDAWYAKWIEEAYQAGILLPCQTEPELMACPLDPLDRAMGAYMMYMAKELTPQ
jgi:parallel beta-helix repeat protein